MRKCASKQPQLTKIGPNCAFSVQKRASDWKKYTNAGGGGGDWYELWKTPPHSTVGVRWPGFQPIFPDNRLKLPWEWGYACLLKKNVLLIVNPVNPAKYWAISPGNTPTLSKCNCFDILPILYLPQKWLLLKLSLSWGNPGISAIQKVFCTTFDNPHPQKMKINHLKQISLSN